VGSALFKFWLKSLIVPETELHRAVGRIEGKLDFLVEASTRGSTRVDRLEKRMRTAERRISWYSGTAAVIAACFSYFVRPD
jgi:hypothetical protein